MGNLHGSIELLPSEENQDIYWCLAIVIINILFLANFEMTSFQNYAKLIRTLLNINLSSICLK